MKRIRLSTLLLLVVIVAQFLALYLNQRETLRQQRVAEVREIGLRDELEGAKRQSDLYQSQMERMKIRLEAAEKKLSSGAVTK